MKRLFKEHWLTILGALLGGLSGYLYWYFVGCTTGTCPLQSSPLYTVVWATVLGAFAFNIIKNLLIKNK